MHTYCEVGYGEHILLLERELSEGSIMVCQAYTARNGAQSTVPRLQHPVWR